MAIADFAQGAISSGGAMWKPPSPCTGSMMIAATRGIDVGREQELRWRERISTLTP